MARWILKNSDLTMTVSCMRTSTSKSTRMNKIRQSLIMFLIIIKLKWRQWEYWNIVHWIFCLSYSHRVYCLLNGMILFFNHNNLSVEWRQGGMAMGGGAEDEEKKQQQQQHWSVCCVPSWCVRINRTYIGSGTEKLLLPFPVNSVHYTNHTWTPCFCVMVNARVTRQVI